MEKTFKKMENGYKLQAYPIKLENNDFPSGQDKAEAIVSLIAENIYHQISIQRLSSLEWKKNKKKNTRTQFQTSIIT